MGAKANLRYHLVFATKYRRSSLLGIENSVLIAFEEAEQGSAFSIERVAVEDGDHVYLIIRTSGTYSVSSMVNRLKSLTTRSLWTSEPNHLKRFYWGKRRKLWSGGYYAATLGEVSAKTVEKYLRKQGFWK